MSSVSYLNLVPYFQFNYKTSADKPAVPLVLETTTDYSNNPRATVAEIYTQIEKDLLSAREQLDGYTPTDNSYITKAVCDGLLARMYLSMAEYAKLRNTPSMPSMNQEPHRQRARR